MNEIRPASPVQLRASDPTASAWVNANAGSGKTHVLVDRLIRLMLAGTDPARILCLTFTKAAAAEMSTRLFDRLGVWVTAGDRDLAELLGSIGVEDRGSETMGRARRLFTAALETPGGLKIQTIHAFCERLLQLFPVEAGIIPHFTVMDEPMAGEILEAARQRALSRARQDGTSDIGAALTEIARHVQAGDFDDLVKAILAGRAGLEGILASKATVDAGILLLRNRLGLAPDDDAVRVRGELNLSEELYRRLSAALRGGSKADNERAAQIESVAAGPGVSLYDLAEFYLTQKMEPRKLKGIATKPVADANPWIAEFVASEQQRLQTGLGKLADLEHIGATRALLQLSAEIAGEYEAEKRRRGAYDFDDLIIRTNRLLGGRPDAAWVLFKLDGGIEHVLLDEAQDTSPAQWEIIRALTVEFFAGLGRRELPDRTLFVVGDRKQSIYSFQGADPNFFEQVHDDFKDRIGSSGQQFRDVDFTVSFRSAQDVLDAVDTVFKTGNVARAGIDGRAGTDLVHESNRRQERGIVELWKLIEPEEKEDQAPWSAPVDREPANSPRRKLARMIAGKVKAWIGSRRIGNSDKVVEPGDILILVRVRNSFFDALIREMRKQGVPVAGADRLKLGESIAILDLLALAHFCLLTGDDHSLACLLKSPLLDVPFSEEQLFELAWNRGLRPLWDAMREHPEAHCQAAAAQLSAWIEAARSRPPYEFFASVLSESRLRFLSRLGGEANDALDAFLDAALKFEADRGSSLQSFVDWFASGDIEIKRNMEQGGNEVRIMTVHGAKGLEAPIVILPDTTSTPDARIRSPLMLIETGNANIKLPLWRLSKRYESEAMAGLKGSLMDDRAHEYRRLLYVAMTRARDELYVCGYGGRSKLPDDCWYNLVGNALKPEMRQIDDDVWRMGIDPVFAGEAQATSKADVAVPDWAVAPAAAESAARRWIEPSQLATTDAVQADIGVRQQRIDRGVLAHRILQLLPEIAEGERLGFIARTVKAAGHEPKLAGELIALTRRPEFSDLFDSSGLSEVPIRAELAGWDYAISGRIDRLILRPNEILAVDFKTDRNWPSDPGGISASYLVQMAAYCQALKAIHPGMHIRCAILWTAAPLLMDIPDIVLDQALDHNPVGRS